MPRRLKSLVFLLPLTLVLAGVAWLVVGVKGAEPRYAGEVALPGLAAPATVRFGPHAVPSVEADSVEDALFAQGYVVASERLWQMDLMRRLAQGRLAEVFGEEALRADRFFRTIGLGASARRSLAELEAPYAGYLNAYAAGVNAYLAKAAAWLPLEYRIAGFRPEPWRAEDSLAIGEYMAWVLSYNVRGELVWLRLARRLGNARAAELFPTDVGIQAPEGAESLPALLGEDGAGLGAQTRGDETGAAQGVAYSATGAAPGLAALAGPLGDLLDLPGRWGLPVPAPASNAWALSGGLTADGQALLANDPHLTPSTPGIWYELELTAPGLHVAGVALPGVPLVLIGHNADLAWGFTTVNADTQDLFVERLSADGKGVERPNGASEPIAARTQRIGVKGRDEPVELTVRSTSHGAVLNDILGPVTGTPLDLPALDTQALLALRWTTDLPDRGFAGVARLATAATLDEGRAAGLDFTHASQNLMLAHRNGGIAWQVTGRMPLRGRGVGTFPSPGWEAGYGWTGYVQGTANPSLTDPEGGVLITANNRTIPANYPVNVTHSWSAPHRARRIADLLAEGPAQDAEATARLQMDRVSLQARDYLAALRRILPELLEVDPQARSIADRFLLNWGGEFRADSRPAALFPLLRTALYRALYGDELGEDLGPLMSLDLAAYSPLDEAIRSGRSSFWDDADTPGREGEAQVWGKALREAHAELQRLLPDPDDQRLDRLRSLTLPHAFDKVPVLGPLFSVGPVPGIGDGATVNVMKASPEDPRRVLFAPSCRAVFSPGDWAESRLVLPLGQSGHRFSPYRSDQLADWLAGRSHPLPWGGPAAGAEIGVLALMPAAVAPVQAPPDPASAPAAPAD
jgi:penicillin amidase